MRRMIIILAVIIFAAFAAPAQEWPESFAGDQIETMDAMKIQAYLEFYNDQNFWGSVDFTGTNFYFGTLDFEICNGDNLANIVFTKIAGRRCVEPPWGTSVDTGCMFTRPRKFRTPVPYTLFWNTDASAYMITADWRDVGTSVTVLTVNADAAQAILQMGVMVPVDGVYQWSENYTQSVYVIAPKTASRYVVPPRPAGERLGFE